MRLVTDARSVRFTQGSFALEDYATGHWGCIHLQEGLQVQTIDVSLSRNMPVRFNRNDPYMEFGCLFSGQLRGSLKTGNGPEQYFTNAPGQLWCSYSDRVQGCVEFISGPPVYSVSFIIHGPPAQNHPLRKGPYPSASK